MHNKRTGPAPVRFVYGRRLFAAQGLHRIKVSRSSRGDKRCDCGYELSSVPWSNCADRFSFTRHPSGTSVDQCRTTLLVCQVIRIEMPGRMPTFANWHLPRIRTEKDGTELRLLWRSLSKQENYARETSSGRRSFTVDHMESSLNAHPRFRVRRGKRRFPFCRLRSAWRETYREC